MQLSSGQKKCLQIFKAFVQKAFIPQIKQSNGTLAEWNIFQSLISAPNITISELQLFVDSLTANTGVKSQKIGLSKKQQEIEQISKQLNNLTKNFGGEKYRTGLATLVQENGMANKRESLRQLRNQQDKSINDTGLMLGLQKILKGMEENQKLIENTSTDSLNSSIKNNRHVLNQLSYNSPVNISSSPLFGTQTSYQPAVSQGINPFYKVNY